MTQTSKGNLNVEKQSHKEVYQTFQKMDTADYMVAFSGLSKNYCIGIVDMVESTKISAEMNEIEWCKYYEIFLNSMAKILPRFGSDGRPRGRPRRSPSAATRGRTT